MEPIFECFHEQKDRNANNIGDEEVSLELDPVNHAVISSLFAVLGLFDCFKQKDSINQETEQRDDLKIVVFKKPL